MDDQPATKGQAATGACEAERAAMQGVCAEARALRDEHARAADVQQHARRQLSAARRALETAQEGADRWHGTAEQKRQLREAYHGAKALAKDARAREAAAATWAREVDIVNRAARLAQRSLASTQADAAAAEAKAHDAENAEHAARLRAESAEAACLEARVRLAACEEGSVLTAGQGAATDVQSGDATAEPGAPDAAAADEAPEGTTPEGKVDKPSGEAGAPAGEAQPASPITLSAAGPRAAPAPQLGRVGAGVPLAIEGLLAADRAVIEMVATRVAELTGRSLAEALLVLRQLVESIAETASERGYLAFDMRHPFWARLSADEARDVVRALAGLGFQIEPGRGWKGDRAPLPSDLSVTLAYAGIDTRAMRTGPSSEELRTLPFSVTVDGRAFLAIEAPDLGLDHVVRALEQRAEALGALWDDWGLVRGVLLAPLDASAAGKG